MWAFLLDLKGEEYIRKLAQQEMFVGRNARQIADALAKGSLALTIGVGYRDFDPFLDANLPVKTFANAQGRNLRQRRQRHRRYHKGRAAPNCGKSIFNWLLSREGQELHGKTAQQPTRRLMWKPKAWTAKPPRM
jgi:ABC-type Fe3+ transport system substrate-binding protein